MELLFVYDHWHTNGYSMISHVIIIIIIIIIIISSIKTIEPVFPLFVTSYFERYTFLRKNAYALLPI